MNCYTILLIIMKKGALMCITVTCLNMRLSQGKVPEEQTILHFLHAVTITVSFIVSSLLPHRHAVVLSCLCLDVHSIDFTCTRTNRQYIRGKS